MSKITDIITTICMIVITIAIVIGVYHIVKPEEVFVQKWTSPETGISYYISNVHIQEIKQ